MTAIITIAVLGFVSYYLLDTFIITRRKDASDMWLKLSHRDKVMLGSYRMWLDYPLLGVGFNNQPFKQISKDYIQGIYLETPYKDKTNFGHAHNVFIHTLASMGIVGFAAFMFLLYAIAKKAWRHVREKEPENLAFFIPFFVTMVFGQTAHPWVGYRFLPAFFTIGLCALEMKSSTTSTALDSAAEVSSKAISASTPSGIAGDNAEEKDSAAQAGA